MESYILPFTQEFSHSLGRWSSFGRLPHGSALGTLLSFIIDCWASAFGIEHGPGLPYHRIMPQIRREIPVIKSEYVCDRCERGVYRLISKNPITSDYIHKWQHRCTHCGDLADFTVPYPLIEVDGKPVSRVFIHREALPTPSGLGSQAFCVSPESN